MKRVRDTRGLTDVSTTAPADGQALVFDATSGLYVPDTVSGGGSMAVDDNGTEVVAAEPHPG